MRSSMKHGLVGRCPRCFIRSEYCICAEVPRVTNRTEVVIVRHQWEARKSTGTARIAQLALARCRCLPVGYDTASADAAIRALQRPWLLFPEAGRAIDPGSLPAEIVVLDGTWSQVVRMRRRLGSLADLPRLALPPKEAAPLRLRASACPEHRSTLEAIADALALIEGDPVSAPLLRLHDHFVEQVLRSRGAWLRRTADRCPAAPEAIDPADASAAPHRGR
jgi:DTW domain-containing protein YfiP